uniref:Uncharacterized protein n=1 Tax=Cucumis melo TaxID=3656 RepID=A0A9I9DE24_CUCME
MHPHLGHDCSRTEASSTARRARLGAPARYKEGWMVQQAFMRMGDCDGDRSFMDKHQLEQTQSTRLRFGCCDAWEMVDGRGGGAAWDVAAWASDEHKLDGELRRRWRL